MEDGSAVILSVAKYYSPSGKAIQDTGVTPSAVVAEPESQVDYDDNGEPIAEPSDAQPTQQKKVENDIVVKKALELVEDADGEFFGPLARDSIRFVEMLNLLIESENHPGKPTHPPAERT